MIELCNIPPEPDVILVIPDVKRYFLRLQHQNTFEDEFDFNNKKSDKVREVNTVFSCDYEDWIKAKTCLWWYDEVNKIPVNSVGITFLDYVGIKGPRLTDRKEKYIFTRDCYEN